MIKHGPLKFNIKKKKIKKNQKIQFKNHEKKGTKVRRYLFLMYCAAKYCTIAYF